MVTLSEPFLYGIIIVNSINLYHKAFKEGQGYFFRWIMRKIKKVYNVKIIYLGICSLFFFNISLCAYPEDTLRIQSSFQDTETKNKIDKTFLREILRKTPVKEIVLSAQFKVLTNKDLGIVLRIEKVKSETESVFRQWGFHTWMSEEGFVQLVNRVHAGKKEGTRIFKEKLLFSKAIWGIIELEDVEILEQTEGSVIPRTEKKVDIQKKGDKVLHQAISEHYKKGEKDKIKQILNTLLKNTQEEIWGWGVHYKACSFSVNWSVDYLKEGIDVRLFDFWEITDNKEEAVERLKKQVEQMTRNEIWDIMDKKHPLSIISLTDEEIAAWFLERIKEEFTVENLERYWGKKLGGIRTLNNNTQLLKIQETILENL